MDKESILALQRIDCNCNDCVFMVRDLEKYHSFDHVYFEAGRVAKTEQKPNLLLN